MAKSYKYNDKTQLTKNINISELKCKDNLKHNILADVKHINNIQSFMNNNGYTKIIISSGYRCPAYNKKLGGSSSSQHCKGTAVDCCFYKNGKIVSAKEVCCKAQKYGFKGIAYINTNYVHLDNRFIGKYRGDETKGFSNNVPNGDFYAYFGISKGNTYQGIFPTLPSRGYFKNGDKGVNVLRLQSLLNWINNCKLSTDGILGKKTIAQVKLYQKKYGLTQDGLFGNNCLIKAKLIIK